ncbi:hypothetical protein Barb7_03062 [Bacteroidales bacterium Barb7]|nr:hypothetical protein Barb7_03062 [Bacteroidales bacterium Barb7]
MVVIQAYFNVRAKVKCFWDGGNTEAIRRQYGDNTEG